MTQHIVLTYRCRPQKFCTRQATVTSKTMATVTTITLDVAQKVVKHDAHVLKIPISSNVRVK